jgi:hypothetical protein
VPEGGLEATEVGKELAEHARHASAGHGSGDHQRRDRVITIVEATLLAVVAVLAAWSGFASAKWGTESRLKLAKASATRTEASRAHLEAQSDRNFDSSTFEAWLAAYVSKDQTLIDVTARRFRPEFKVAFDAWMRSDPFNNPDAPAGPTYVPEYHLAKDAQGDALDAQADAFYDEGSKAGENADGYVRTTVFLATVLFLAGMSGHFRFHAARIGLLVVAAAILFFSVVQIIVLPRPPPGQEDAAAISSTPAG